MKPIWQLVEGCAFELTRTGQAPFSRIDIIHCIQSKNPDLKADSINPIIQGMTDNLKGGAPGSVGKDILHSVARGRFILLKTSIKEDIKPNKSNTEQLHVKKAVNSSKSIELDSYSFQLVCRIEPITNEDSSILELYPQNRYNNQANLPLNRYGVGPFCQFTIPNNFKKSGVYAIISGTKLKYIGECENLSNRYNSGYGQISPRNCFQGGQETNCRINNLILQESKRGSDVLLYFFPTTNFKELEINLRRNFTPIWNRV